ncbi:DEAD/DEAH box helicase [Bifidobacterium moraviense]|nr:DEAD/DEAH box helicase [Bifidobacterium sp. DSM 109958]
MPAPLTADAPEAAAAVLESCPVPFAELGVPEPLVRVLAADGKTEAFPIQADTLPDSLAGRDILGRGRTGSGKTLAFCLPLAARLCEAPFEPGMTMADYRRGLRRMRDRRLEERVDAKAWTPSPRGLVLAPTRELANQINDVLTPFAGMCGMTTSVIYGGVKQSRQVRELRAGADIVVACPGRLEDLLRQGLLTLSAVEIVVIDEADEMADMGFLPPVRRLLAQIRPDAQHMLFSATLDHGIDDLVREFLRNPKTHSVPDAAMAADAMTQHVFLIDKANKLDVVRALAGGAEKRMLFTRTKYQAKNLARKLTQQGIPAAELHGNLSQNQRDRNLAAFESGDVNVMVATDVAARGIDVSGVRLVVQVDPPEDPKSFVHRSGRTARAGHTGDVVTLVLPDQRREARRMLRAAGIDATPIAVRDDSPEVLDLVGERAERVDGWTLDASQPAGGNSGKGGRKTKPGKKTKDDRKAQPDKPRRKRGAEHADERADERTHEHSEERMDDRTHEHVARRSPMHAALDAYAADRTANHADRRGASDDAASRKALRHLPVLREDRSDRQNDRRADGKRRHADAVTHGKRIHRSKENRIVRDERSEDAKRHERRMIAKYGSADGPRRRHSKRRGTPFR